MQVDAAAGSTAAAGKVNSTNNSHMCSSRCSTSVVHHSSDDSCVASSSCNIVVCAHWRSPCIRLLAVCLTGTHSTVHTLPCLCVQVEDYQLWMTKMHY
jgi:hypothetical protein